MNTEQLTALFDLSEYPLARERHHPSVWTQLERLGVVDGTQVTSRGQAFIEHVCALPLPERVTAWRIPRVAPSPGAFIEDLQTFGSAALHINGIDEDGDPPKGPMPKPFAIVSDIPADPELLKLQANNLLDRGFSVGEVTRELNLTPDQATSFFQGR